MPWASGISLVAFGLVEGRSLGRSQHPCLCPARDRVCTRPIGTPGACVPWGTICVHIPEETMHVCIPQGSTLVCIPQGHRGTCVRSCHCRSSSASPCPHHFPRRVQVTCGRGGVRVVRCTSPVDKQRDAVSRGCWFSATFVHTRVENRVCVGGCASKYRLDYLGSVLHSQAHSLQLAESLPRPAPPGAHWHRQQSSEQVIKRL